MRRRDGGRRLAALSIAALLVAAWVAPARGAPPATPERVPVLILDGGLGDSRFYASHWLGETPEEIASEGAFQLLTSAKPIWHEGGESPDTYVLTSSEGEGKPGTAATGVAEIAWALDRLAERHPEGKAVIVAQGAAGLQARAYLEDLGEPKQSERADVVGLVMLGTPNAGLTLPATYPDLDVWGPYAAGAGLEPSDLAPGSDWLGKLDGGRFPSVVRALVLQGVAVRLAGYETDGVAVRADSRLATGVACGSVDHVPVRARASEAWQLRTTWLPKTKKGGARLEVVDGDEVERLAPSSGYAASPDVADAVSRFYDAWFAKGAPTTHVSSRLLVDVSGSMAGEFGDGSKLDAARAAGSAFVDLLSARQGVSGAVPEDVGLVVFDETPEIVASPGSKPEDVKKALKGLDLGGNTDVGRALEAAVDTFDDSPATAEKVLVLLSDGVNTEGLDEKGILSGPVADAKKRGVRIETIALGGVDSSDAGFLKEVAKASGGRFHQARDLFELRRDFLRARYESLGEVSRDKAVELPSPAIPLGDVGEGARLFEVGFVPDGKLESWKLTLDGEPLPEEALEAVVLPDGTLSVAVASPQPGAYALQVEPAKGVTRGHVFSVRQADAFRATGAQAPEDSTAFFLLIGGGGLAVLALAATVASGIRGRRRPQAQPLADGRSAGTSEDGE